MNTLQSTLILPPAPFQYINTQMHAAQEYVPRELNAGRCIHFTSELCLNSLIECHKSRNVRPKKSKEFFVLYLYE